MLTPDQVTHRFKHTLRNSKHDVVGGFHVLRNSFISNLVRMGKVPSHVYYLVTAKGQPIMSVALHFCETDIP